MSVIVKVRTGQDRYFLVGDRSTRKLFVEVLAEQEMITGQPFVDQHATKGEARLAAGLPEKDADEVVPPSKVDTRNDLVEP